MNILNTLKQLANSIDLIIDNLNIFNFSFVIDADLEALNISEALGLSETLNISESIIGDVALTEFADNLA